MTFCCAVAVIESALGDDAYLAAVDVCLVVGLQAFAAAAGSLGINLTAIDGHHLLAGQSCCSLGLQVCRVPFAVTRTDDGCTTTVNREVGVAIDTLCTGAGCLHIDDAAVDDDVLGSLDAVVGSVDIEVDTLLEHDVAFRVDAVVVNTVDL